MDRKKASKNDKTRLVCHKRQRFPDYLGLDDWGFTNAPPGHLTSGQGIVTDGVTQPHTSQADDDPNKQAWKEGVKGSGWNTLIGNSGGRWDNISTRLTRRKVLIGRGTILTDVMSSLALVGILCNLAQTELFISHGFEYDHQSRRVLLMVLTISTLALLATVVVYHATQVELAMVESGIEVWGLFIDKHQAAWIVFEFLVCAIQPIPEFVPFESEPAVNSGLSILMFMRLYLLGRILVVHSRLVSDTATQSLGAINKVKINSSFVMKAMMTVNPGMILIATMLLILMLGTWSVRTCESYYAISNNLNDTVEGQFLQTAAWLTAVTFLTVGYGDAVPVSGCGKITCITIGLLGVGISSLLVAVIGAKMEQSRAEKYLHCFVSRVSIDKEYRTTASEIIRCVVRFWRLNREKNRSQAYKKRRGLHIYGQLIQAARRMRELKNQRANIQETAIGIIEVHSNTNATIEMMECMKAQQEVLFERSSELEERLNKLELLMEAIAYQVVPNFDPSVFYHLHDLGTKTDPDLIENENDPLKESDFKSHRKSRIVDHETFSTRDRTDHDTFSTRDRTDSTQL